MVVGGPGQEFGLIASCPVKADAELICRLRGSGVQSEQAGELTAEQVYLINDMIHAWIDPEKKGEFRQAFRNDCKRLLATVSPSLPSAEPRTQPSPPTELHWLGDRESADATRHASDATGCVMYFQTESDCLRFMRWVGELCSCGGSPGQQADHHDISCPLALSSTHRGSD